MVAKTDYGSKGGDGDGLRWWQKLAMVETVAKVAMMVMVAKTCDGSNGGDGGKN